MKISHPVKRNLTQQVSKLKQRKLDNMIAKLMQRDEADMAQFRRLIGYVKPYTRELLWGVFGVTLASLLGLTLPLFARRIFNTSFLEDGLSGEGGIGIAQLNQTVLWLLLMFTVQAFFNYVRVYNLAKVGEGVVADLRKHLYNHLLDLPMAFFATTKTGEITSRLTSDIETLRAMVSNALAQLINQTILLLGGVVFLFVMNARLSLVMLLIVPAIIIASAFFGRRLRKLSTKFQDSIAAANAAAEEAIVGVRVVKSFTAEQLEKQRYGDLVNESYEVSLERAHMRAIFVPSVLFAMFSGLSIVLWYGGRLVLTGDLLAGDLIAFLMLTLFIAGSISTFIGLYSQFQEALGASKRIFELLDEDSDLPTSKNPIKLEPVRGQVDFADVSFHYGKDRDEALVLNAVKLEAQAGEVIALVGPSGAGKSTFVSLLPRFYDPSEGSILLDGIDLRDLTLQNLRQAIGIVPQETQLFSGTIAENIEYGRPNASQADIEAAAKAANAHEFIRNFPAGYDTVVGERGVKLSGGQRQRVAIARAILKNPRILILDEATSALDNESEALVQEALEHLMQGRTTFVIAHRLSTIKDADRIVVLDEGAIVQEGSHQELLAQGGLYKDLYEKQFQTRASNRIKQ